MTSDNEMKEIAILDQAVSAFRRNRSETQPPLDLSESVVNELEHLSSVSQPLAHHRVHTSGRWVGMIASVAAMMFLGVCLWLGVSGHASLAAEVIDAVSQVKTVTYEMIHSMEGEPDQLTKVMVAGPGRYRAELPSGEVLIVDTSQERQFRLFPEEKRATLRSAFPTDAMSVGESDRLLPLKSLPMMSQFKTTELPSRVIDNQKTVGFVCNEGPYVDLKVWVDPDTLLPVRMESASKDASTGKPVHEVTQNIVYNDDLDETLFNVAAPSDYQVDSVLASSSTAEPNTFPIVPNEGVGSLHFGMKESEVIETLGKPINRKPAPKGQLLEYGAHGLHLEISSDEGLRVIHCISQASYGFNVRSFAGKTDKGVGVGSSIQQIRAAYGKPVQEYHNQNAGLMSYISPVVTFQFIDDVVCEVTLLKPGKAE